VNVSLRQLKGFLLVAKFGSFTRAAEQLHITQAGLSAMMRDLERQFGCRLFDRTTRSVSLTREGASLIASAQVAVDQLEHARESVQRTAAAARRMLTIAVTPMVASVLAPEVCRVFAEREPGVEVRIRDVARRDIQGLVERGEVDVGFGVFLKTAAGTELHPLLRFQLAYIAPAGAIPKDALRSRAEGLPSMPWSRLPDIPLIALAPETPVQEVVEECLVETGMARPYRQVCNSMQTMLALVGAGFGAAILPSMVVPSCPRAKFHVVRLTGPATYVQFYQISKKGHHLSPVVAPFVETMAEVVKQLCATQPQA
jgi:DNA-binding transcriptional LysR family regulator